MTQLNRIIVAAAAALSLAQARPAPPSPAPHTLTVEDRAEPIDVGDPSPEFGWQAMAGKGFVQSAFQIHVASTAAALAAGRPDRWDSGTVKGSASAYVSYAGGALRSREAAFWRVRVWDAGGLPSAWSKAARFETGLLGTEDWAGAHWMWGDAQADREAHFYFRRAINLKDRSVARARAYVTASHLYELFVDGARVGKGPAFAYPDYQLYQTIDLTDALRRPGGHVIGVTGRWFGSGQGRPEARGGVLLKIVVDFADGTQAVFASGPEWKVRKTEWRVPDAKVSARNFRNGEGIPVENIDAREAPIAWASSAFDDSAWGTATVLGPHPTAPWTGALIAQETSIDEHELVPASVRELTPTRFVADFGKVYAGRPVVTFEDGPAGSPVTVTTDYRTQPDGSLKGFAQSTKMDYGYTLRGGRETFEPYGYLGFRYVQVDLPAGMPRPPKIAVIARSSRVDDSKSSFRSSDKTLNAVWDLVKHSARYGSQEGFVDTPTREQAQFTYDAYQISRAVMRAFGERDLTQRALREFAQSQVKFHQDSGKVNAVYPNGDGKRDIPDWTQSWPMWAWEYYFDTGDLELIRDIFPELVRTGEYVKGIERKDNGLVDLGSDLAYRSGIVDWPNRYSYDRKTTQRTVMTINAYLVYTRIAKLAAALSRPDVEARFQGYAAAAQQAIEKLLWDDQQNAYVDGLYEGGGKSASASQQTNAMMAALGLAKGDRLQGALAAVKRAGFQTSPVLVRFLIQAYGENDEDEALYDFLLNPTGRNFASTLAGGGTFTWESWEGINFAGNETSESHAYGANAGLEAIQRYVLGVDPTAAQAERLRIRPHPGSLASAEGVVPTERGPVSVAWTATPRGLDLRVTLPGNVRGDVYVPVADAAQRQLNVDGVPVLGERAGRYVVVRNVGPGGHRFRP